MRTYRITLAILLITVSLTAFAGKPATTQTITSPPMIGDDFACLMSNVSDHDISDVSAALIDAIGTAFDDDYYIPLGWTVPHFRESSFDVVRCKVQWVGQPDDIRATLCSYKYVDGPPDYINAVDCFELN